MIQNQQAHVGMMESCTEYPADISFSRLPIQGELGLYVLDSHPLAKEKNNLSTFNDDSSITAKQ